MRLECSLYTELYESADVANRKKEVEEFNKVGYLVTVALENYTPP